MKIYIIILTGILLFLSNITYADDFILPKSFSIDKSNLSIIKDQQKIKPAIIIKNGKPDNTDNTVSVKHTQPIKESLPLNTEPVITNISLLSLIKNFNYDYSKTFKSVITTLNQFGIEIVSYDSSRGQINARLDSGRELFIMLLPSKETLTHVRITPADGRYNISTELVDKIFKNIDRNLYSDIN